ncbi:hypothetical protein [Ralstonia pseudosolanacearum]|nr:hypothetical protein [Ralstonia pseudosolanacearum]MDO3553086.1 hypothetical protein [Ralstonia pseudosolanacearum]MDO3582228.1 hypothetical protein [Ralstonia pseudosolanacearum]
MPNVLKNKNTACAADFIIALHEIAQHELIVVPAVAFCLAIAFGGAA